jgi:hypothetical protein
LLPSQNGRKNILDEFPDAVCRNTVKISEQWFSQNVSDLLFENKNLIIFQPKEL